MDMNRTAPETVEEKRRRTDAEIVAYATAVAGTEEDLDPALEAAGVEFWISSSECECGVGQADDSATSASR